MGRFSSDYNRRHDCSGTLWERRYRSMLVAGDFIAKTGALVELFAVRAGKALKAEEYAFCGFGAASRGDQTALDGIIELIAPRKTLADYKRVIDACAPTDTLVIKQKPGRPKGALNRSKK